MFNFEKYMLGYLLGTPTLSYKTGMSCWTQRILGRRRGAKWYHAAPARGAMGPDRNCRQLNCPVPITPRAGALLRLPWRLPFHINIHGC